jgi:hypothetical protein
VLVHRDPDAYPDPDDFRPERFLDTDVDQLPYLPFGGGVRRCLGRWLARAEIGTVIPAVLRRLWLRPLSKQPERMVVRGTVLVPQRGATVVARAASGRARRPAATGTGSRSASAPQAAAGKEGWAPPPVVEDVASTDPRRAPPSAARRSRATP